MRMTGESPILPLSLSGLPARLAGPTIPDAYTQFYSAASINYARWGFNKYALQKKRPLMPRLLATDVVS
jgi:hypothetical protein